MARRDDKLRALELREKGYSYSQIKSELGISKSTLSGWLSDFPLSPERIFELRDKSPQRIEKYRNTMQLKRENRLHTVYKKVSKDIGVLTPREVFVAGLFLYWGEGFKSSNATTGFANSDPASCKFFLRWLSDLGVKQEKIVLRIQLYSDMNIEKEIKYWSKELNFPKDKIRVRVKESKFSSLTYTTGFHHGTCNIYVYNRDLSEYILIGLKYLREYSGNINRP